MFKAKLAVNTYNVPVTAIVLLDITLTDVDVSAVPLTLPNL